MTEPPHEPASQNWRAMKPPDDLAAENMQVLNMVQALLGILTSSIRAISIKCVGRQIEVHFAVYQASQECMETIDDIMFEFECLQSCGMDISRHITVNNSPIGPNELLLEGRPVLLRAD